ncbi:MAG TPA: type II toxin-antitoxin system PemK/MazF family toxin [bacterium]|nr:type II toxin-antitoxin system PemK/MazF family toxin [bacterium]
MTTKTSNPQRGEIWNISFDPQVGDEIKKIRPAVVLSDNNIGILKLRIVVPITAWQKSFEGCPWLVQMPKSENSGLDKISVADAFQVKSISLDRFVDKRGELKAKTLDEVVAGVALCIGFS